MFKSYKQNLLHIHPGFEKNPDPKDVFMLFFPAAVFHYEHPAFAGPGAMSSAMSS